MSFAAQGIYHLRVNDKHKHCVREGSRRVCLLSVYRRRSTASTASASVGNEAGNPVRVSLVVVFTPPCYFWLAASRDAHVVSFWAMSVQVPSRNVVMDDEDDVPPDLDLDLWEGQFEFVGRGYVAPVEDDDDVLDLFPAVPKPGHNGDSRNKAYLWAGTLTNQVSH